MLAVILVTKAPASRWGFFVSASNSKNPRTMSRTLYSPRLSDDVVRALYREGQRRRVPMTRLADDLLWQSLGSLSIDPPVLRVCEGSPEPTPLRSADAA